MKKRIVRTPNMDVYIVKKKIKVSELREFVWKLNNTYTSRKAIFRFHV